MSQEERQELTRAQREVMWNLQKDYVVTIVSPGDDPVPYKRQGNPAVNTPSCIRRRLSLRKKPLIQVCTNTEQTRFCNANFMEGVNSLYRGRKLDRRHIRVGDQKTNIFHFGRDAV